MKAKKMQPRVMWGVMDAADGWLFGVSPTRDRARAIARVAVTVHVTEHGEHYNKYRPHRVVRVRVTEAP